MRIPQRVDPARNCRSSGWQSEGTMEVRHLEVSSLLSGTCSRAKGRPREPARRSIAGSAHRHLIRSEWASRTPPGLRGAVRVAAGSEAHREIPVGGASPGLATPNAPEREEQEQRLVWCAGTAALADIELFQRLEQALTGHGVPLAECVRESGSSPPEYLLRNEGERDSNYSDSGGSRREICSRKIAASASGSSAANSISAATLLIRRSSVVNTGTLSTLGAACFPA